MKTIGLIIAGLLVIRLGLWLQKKAGRSDVMSKSWQNNELLEHEQHQRRGHSIW